MEPSPKTDSPITAPKKNALAISLAVLALIVSSVSLFFVLHPMHTISHTDHARALQSYANKQNEKQAQFTAQVADSLHDPSASLHLYQMALSQTHSKDLKKSIQTRITTLHHMGHHDTKTVSHLYKQLLAIATEIDHMHPSPPKTTDTHPIVVHASPWDHAKETFLQVVHVERIPDHVMYDVTPTEQALLINRVHYQIALAQWGVLNHNDSVYSPAIQTAKIIVTHWGVMERHTNLLAQINMLPSSLVPKTPKADPIKKDTIEPKKKHEVNP